MAFSERDGPRALEALRRLIAQTAHDEDLLWLWAAAQKELGDSLTDRSSEDPDQNIEDVIAAYTAAVCFYSQTIFPAEYATAHNNLGNAYLHRRRGSREDNLERAIESYTAALAIRTREADPYGWARTQNNLGNAYSERIRGERIENQRLAIKAYMAALEVHRIEEYPDDFSMDKMNLALAYQEFTGGQRAKNLDLAIASFLCALVVRGDARRYHRIVLSVIDALRDRMALTPAAMRGSVAAGLEPAVELLREAVLWPGAPNDIRRLATDLTQIEGGATTAEAASWMPDANLFAEFRRARYMAMPLQELVATVSFPVAQADTPHFIELLRAVLDRPDVLLPSFRSHFWDQLGIALLSLRSGDVAAHQKEAISCFESALAGLDRNEHRRDWAAVQNHLAAAYAGRIAGDRAENVEVAIEHCKAAIEACSRESEPEEWRIYTALLGQLYRDRRMGDRRENIVQSIEQFALMLREHTRESDPYMWARTKISLGVAHRELDPTSASATELAIDMFNDASRVLNREEHANEWAGAQLNLGKALTDRKYGIRERNIERAIAAFEVSLTVWGRDYFASDWGRAHHNLGQAYRHHVSGDREHDLELAARHLRQALEVHTVHERPFDHLLTAGALGSLEAARANWSAALEAFTSASAAHDDLLAEVTTGARGFDDLVKEGHDVSELIGFAFVKLGQPEAAVAAIEHGRARQASEALSLNMADPNRILDPDRRRRYLGASAELGSARAAVNNLNWSGDHMERTGGTGQAAAGPAGSDEPLALMRAARAARERFDEIVGEIESAGDPADFFPRGLSARELAVGIDAAVVYLLSTGWGGLALAVRAAANGGEGEVVSCALPELTDEFVSRLVQVTLGDGSGRIIGGFAVAQEGLALNWIANRWPGDTVAEKAEHLHAACVEAGAEGELDRSMQTVLALPNPGLRGLLDTALEELTAPDISRIAATLNHECLRAELARCLPKLAGAALRPMASWLLGLGIESITLVPCGALAAFPLLAAPFDDASTIADRLVATVAPSGRSVLTRSPGHATRSGLHALGDPRPTHQELRWGEAEALTVAALAGEPSLARVGERATRPWMVESVGSAYVLSASCHGEFDGTNFLRSRLLLAGGEELTLGDVLDAEIEMSGLRLLVLSACQTAVLDIRGASGEVRSLAAGMLQAGARAVMGALWSVDDRATYLLMVRFAQEWLPVMHEQSPASALARAQAWLRTVTNGDLSGWRALPDAAEFSGASVAQAQAGLIAVRGRGDRYATAEAEELITGLASRRAGDLADLTPYADPIFWAGFQVHGH